MSEGEAGEIQPEEIWGAFTREYLEREEPYSLSRFSSVTTEDGRDEQVVDLVVRGEERSFKGEGNGPVAAFVDGMRQAGADIRVLDYSEHALSEGGNAMAAAYVECAVGERVLWGVGIDANTSMSSLKAVISAVNRAIRDSQA